MSFYLFFLYAARIPLCTSHEMMYLIRTKASLVHPLHCVDLILLVGRHANLSCGGNGENLCQCLLDSFSSFKRSSTYVWYPQTLLHGAYILSREKKNYRGIFQVTHKDIFKAEMTPGVWGYSLTHAAKISRNLVWVTENFAAAKAMARGHSSTKAMAFESATQAKASLAASLRDATLRFRTAVLCPVDCCSYGSGPLRDHLPARHPQWQQQAARCLPLLTELPGGSCVIVSVYQCISVIVSHNIHTFQVRIF